MTKVKKIVLTGGPSGGKSTLQQAIATQIEAAYCVPEFATILLSGGFPAPSDRHPWEDKWQRDFQVAVAIGQLALENISVRRAEKESKLLTVFDRGLLDGAAYLTEGVRELERITGQDEKTMLDSYDMVIHLTTTAAHNYYDKQSNPHRFEEAAEALALDQRLMKVWQNHPRHVVINNTQIQDRINEVLKIIKDLISN